MSPSTGMPGADPAGERNSFLRVEKSLLGECDAREQAELEADMAADPALRAYYEDAKLRQSNLRWDRLQARIAAKASAQVESSAAIPSPRNRPSGTRFLETFFARMEAGSPRPRAAIAWAGGLALLAVVAPLTWMSTQAGPGLRAKGGFRPEVVLKVDGARLASGGHASAKPGTILGFAYKSTAPLSAQIWYVEDSAAPDRFDGKNETSLAWKASPEWSVAPQRIELEGAWKTQRVVVVVSDKALPASQVASWVSRGSHPGSGAYIFTFHLEQR